MTREEAIDCINAIHVQMFNSGNSKWTEACDMAIEALKNIQVKDKIPQNYLYDAETENCLVYRHKYTGKEIHILKPTDLFVLERPQGEWIKESLQIDEHHFRSYAKCKVCGCSFKPYSFAVKEFDFCPKCGSDNRKRGESNAKQSRNEV